ncbi:hypothetical protein V6N13_044196 [Hibiscus sabdariffa]
MRMGTMLIGWKIYSILESELWGVYEGLKAIWGTGGTGARRVVVELDNMESSYFKVNTKKVCPWVQRMQFSCGCYDEDGECHFFQLSMHGIHVSVDKCRVKML